MKPARSRRSPKTDIRAAGSKALDQRPAPMRQRVWAFRLIAVVVSPLLFFLLLELVLRLAGFGERTAFLLPARINGQRVFVQNDRFGWRFFGPERAREPAPLVIPAAKPAGTIRLFVFGESAAFGDPQPEFGLPRMLQALLEDRFPGKKFEVFNVAMTAINSHAILPIARECARHEGDIWVLYMGNNEVVGPYEPGSVFSRNTPGVAWVRLVLALKKTRTAQALERLLSRADPTSPAQEEWGGMQMFLEHRVRSTDRSLARVYDNFKRNLGDILATGRKQGAKIVVSTVASNLRDCAPFASLHRADLGAADLARWDGLYQKGTAAQARGDFQQALDWYQQAGKIDGAFAELHFRNGQCALALGRREEALSEFKRARDEDTLRFRCDSRLNEILEQAAASRSADGILFADARAAAGQADTNGVPGHECFYEHVHLTFEGNYRLALSVAHQVAQLLPESITRGTDPGRPWPSLEDCARRLGWSPWNEYEADQQMLGRLQDPPFTAQLNWKEETRRLGEQLERLRPGTEPAGLRDAEARCRAALTNAPNDWQLLHNLARLQDALGEFRSAADSWRRIADLLPFEAEIWQGLGNALAKADSNSDAKSAFERALRLNPKSLAARTGLGQLYLEEAKYADAAQQFERVLKSKSYWGPAQLGLGKALEGLGRSAEAQAHFREALKNRINTPGSYKALGHFCFEKKWYPEAAANFNDALRLDPADAPTHVNLGLTLALLGRPTEAQEQYAEAVRLDPNLAEARVRLGTSLGRAGQDGAALEQFAAAVRLKPDLLEARLNLGIALTKVHRNEEALAQFQEVLRQHPGNPVAARYVEALQKTGTR